MYCAPTQTLYLQIALSAFGAWQRKAPVTSAVPGVLGVLLMFVVRAMLLVVLVMGLGVPQLLSVPFWRQGVLLRLG